VFCLTVRSGFLARFLIMARYVLVQGPCHRQEVCQKAIRQGYRAFRPPKRWYVSCYCKEHATGKKRAKPGGRGLPGQGRGWVARSPKKFCIFLESVFLLLPVLPIKYICILLTLYKNFVYFWKAFLESVLLGSTVLKNFVYFWKVFFEEYFFY